MFELESVLRLHEETIKRFGGSNGVRDNDALDGALARPFQTFGGEYLYQNVYEKAAAILESIIMNHPFVDGNKRMGLMLAATLLRNSSLIITGSEDDRYQFVVDVATGDKRFEEAVDWLRTHTSPAKL